jgi:uncharacterized OsmC-like protein
MLRAADTKRTSAERIRSTFERNAKALALRPSIGQGTAVTRVRLQEALTCEVQEGNWTFTADMNEKSGGENRGPNPGILGRAALGSCLAIGYALWAAKLEVAIDSLEVEVQADYDSRAIYGIDNVEPGYAEVRYIVHVASAAPESEVLRLIEMADAHSDFLHVFTRPQRVRREVRHKRVGG